MKINPVDKYRAAKSGEEILRMCEARVAQAGWPDQVAVVMGAVLCAQRVIHLTGRQRLLAEAALSAARAWAVCPCVDHKRAARRVARAAYGEIKWEPGCGACIYAAEAAARVAGARMAPKAAYAAATSAGSIEMAMRGDLKTNYERAVAAQTAEECAQVKLLYKHFACWPALAVKENHPNAI